MCCSIWCYQSNILLYLVLTSLNSKSGCFDSLLKKAGGMLYVRTFLVSLQRELVTEYVFANVCVCVAEKEG